MAVSPESVKKLVGLGATITVEAGAGAGAAMLDDAYRAAGATVAVAFPAELQERATVLGRSAGASLFMVLLTAFQALLHRLSGQDDLSVGTPVAGRNRVEIEPLVGFFVNTLVMRSDGSGDPGFGELLARTRTRVLGALAHHAGVEHDHVGLLDIGLGAVAKLLEGAGDSLGVAHVHLTAFRPNVILHHSGDSTI